MPDPTGSGPSGTDPIGTRLDVTAGESSSPSASTPPQARPFLQVQFNCCRVYQRVYQTPDKTRYQGHCPRCGRQITFVVGPGGTDCRQFVVE